MSVLPQIIEWSRERPLWQQDALRRLAEQPHLTAADHEALVALCKIEHGLQVPDAPKPQPLAALDLATAPAGAAPIVRLKGVRGARNVNALRDDQELTIATRGVTVVYGDNGAGKSGYVRVLKQVCRARGGRDAVHANVFDEDPQPACAVVAFVVERPTAADGVNPALEHREITWTTTAEDSPEELAQVSVFDTRSAAVYVSKQNDVAYLPYGTDLFPKLVHVCDVVKQALETEIGQIERDRFETIPAGTAAHALLQELHDSKARERVDLLATLTDDDRERLEQLRVADQRFRSEDPLARAKERRQCASRLSAARERLTVLSAALDHAAIGGLRAAHEALSTARAAATLASGEAFANAPLGGVGGDPWRALWDAARRFATQTASPTQPFPPPIDREGAVCVLCQQELTSDARHRMHGFEQFVRGETRREVDRAMIDLEERIASLDAIQPQTIADAALIEELRSLDEELEAMLSDCAVQLAERRQAVLAAARTAEPSVHWDQLVYVPADAIERLVRLEERMRAEADRYDAAVDPAVRKATEAALRELEARAELGKLRERVYAEIERQKRRLLLSDAVKSTATTAITKRSTEVLREAISEPLAEEFARQIVALNLTHLPVSIDASHGQKGRAFHCLSLGMREGAKAPTDEVLSEGELRCTALAAFFAEVSLQGSASTVVFDDPVSSLDHVRRGYVARQVIEISRTRPVLVFTHDLAFLWMLHDTAEAIEAPLTPRYVRRDAQGPGLVSEEWPWDGLTVRSRAGKLKQDLVQLKKLAADDRPAYERYVRLFYGRLRDTWERSVEELLFNSAVRRFNPEVQTLRLRNLHRITEAQMETFKAGMTKTSRWIQGHDHAAALALPLPEYDEVSGDFATFEQWMESIRKQNDTKN